MQQPSYKLCVIKTVDAVYNYKDYYEPHVDKGLKGYGCDGLALFVMPGAGALCHARPRLICDIAGGSQVLR